jgi:hypothetical protein
MADKRSRPVVAHRATNDDRSGMRGDKTREAHFFSPLVWVCKASRTRRLLAGAPDESP